MAHRYWSFVQLNHNHMATVMWCTLARISEVPEGELQWDDDCGVEQQHAGYELDTYAAALQPFETAWKRKRQQIWLKRHSKMFHPRRYIGEAKRRTELAYDYYVTDSRFSPPWNGESGSIIRDPNCTHRHAVSRTPLGDYDCRFSFTMLHILELLLL
jgi:hypothetical protein